MDRPPTTLDVAGVSVPPGAARRHALEVGELADGLRVSLPLALVNGRLPGPRLYLGAAIHGDEINGLAILTAALQRIRPENLSGSLVCVMVQNPLAFHVDHRIPIGHYLKSPLDQTPIDPWTCFPGNPAGPLAAMLADRLFGLILASDYAIDIHTPTRGGRYVPIAILPPSRLGEPAQRAEALAMAFGSGYLMKTDKGMYVSDGILSVEATRAGVPAFTFEIGEGGRLEPDLVEVGARCVLNALHHLGMVPETLGQGGRMVRMREFVGLRSTRGGVLYTEASLGAFVKKGDLLARIVSVYGDELERFPAPVDGLFVRSTTLATVSSGERVATIGLLE
jgi:predicted deacylase